MLNPIPGTHPENENSRNVYEVEELPQNSDDRLILLEGDVLQQMRGLPDRCINCCITSPPYYGLRDYQVPGQLGLESTVEEYIANQVAVFREVRRLLVDDGICFVVVGDSYAGSGRGPGGKSSVQNGNKGSLDIGRVAPAYRKIPAKNLLLIPQHLAIGLQRDGWIVRSEIIWAKRNCMPESVQDRCTKAHETVWMLAKCPHHYCNMKAVEEEAIIPAGQVATHSLSGVIGDDQLIAARNHHGPAYVTNGYRNKRDVWTTSTTKDKNARGCHFATFNAELITPAVLMGCPEGGVILDCYAGSGSTGEVALAHGRQALLIELNPTYCTHIEKRLGCTRVSNAEAAARLSPEERSAKARREAAMRLWRKLNSESTIGNAEKDAA